MAEQVQDAYEKFVLRNDEGAEFSFRGKIFSETSFYDDDQGSLTRLKLFITDDNRQVYSIVSGTQAAKSRRVYTMTFEGDLCRLGNGLQEITLPVDMLLTVVFGLCGIDPAQGDTVRAFIEDTRKTAT